MSLFAVSWMLQEFPEPRRTDPRSAENRRAPGGRGCLETEGGRPRAGWGAAVSEPRLAACTRAELPGVGAAVPATRCAGVRTRLIRRETAALRGGDFVGGRGGDSTCKVGCQRRRVANRSHEKQGPRLPAKCDSAGQRSPNTAHVLTRPVGMGLGGGGWREPKFPHLAPDWLIEAPDLHPHTAPAHPPRVEV